MLPNQHPNSTSRHITEGELPLQSRTGKGLVCLNPM
ncbi:hypothetical protein SAMN05216233_104191 [Desulfoluna spongiiphila]|uniref:Uncharacterized protein n=1 Tax=Desulfoluna spongiiphila TaxID=419481 RepID=A0A1G5DH88_9BACT|nr:hypothetical protein SAMN05216233_104191 [Desulfoluna spongiiphila]VVS95132.1 consensus disorder prediction [Desulfoluna spongiiphila]